MIISICVTFVTNKMFCSSNLAKCEKQLDLTFKVMHKTLR